MSWFRKSLAAAAAVSALALASAPAHAAGVSDNFEGYSNATTLNFTGFTNLTVSSGSVDLIGTPNGYGLSTPYGTGFVDLDGTTNAGGTLTTGVFSFNAGDVVSLDFDLSGNQRGGSADDFSFGIQTAGGNIVFNNLSITNIPLFGGTLNFGNFGTGPAVASGFGTLSSSEAWEHYNLTFTAGNAGSLSAFVGTSSNDNVGPLLDNFSLSVGAVPEPSAWALMLVGVGMVGGMARRRRSQAAVAAV